MARQSSREKQALDELHQVLVAGELDTDSRQRLGTVANKLSAALDAKADPVIVFGTALRRLGPVLVTGLTVLAGIITIWK